MRGSELEIACEAFELTTRLCKIPLWPITQIIIIAPGPYFSKCILDVFVPATKIGDATIGRHWPCHGCPGYEAAIAQLAPSLPKEHFGSFLLFTHRALSPRHRLSLPESLAQLCWHHRRQSGLLEDAQPEKRRRLWRARSSVDE